MTASERTQMYMAYLKDEGFSPTVNQFEDVVFKFEGLTCVIDIDDRDGEFFQIIVPNIFRVEDEDKRALALAAANSATSNMKVAKIILVGDSAWASFETFLATPDAFEPVFRRSLRALQEAIRHFATHLRDHAGSGAQPAKDASATSAGVLAA